MAFAALAAPIHAAPRHIDHVIVGVPDLDRGIAAVQQATGVRPRFGGAHPGNGTRNALLSLGNGTYLELFAPNPAEPVASADVVALRKLSAPTPIGWAVTVTDMAALRATLAKAGFPLAPPAQGSRRLPDGSVLRWRASSFAHFDDPMAPFFIQWTNPALHPSRDAPAGCTLQSLDIREPAPARLGKLIIALALPVKVERGPTASISLTLSCPTGKVELG